MTRAMFTLRARIGNRWYWASLEPDKSPPVTLYQADNPSKLYRVWTEADADAKIVRQNREDVGRVLVLQQVGEGWGTVLVDPDDEPDD